MHPLTSATSSVSSNGSRCQGRSALHQSVISPAPLFPSQAQPAQIQTLQITTQ